MVSSSDVYRLFLQAILSRGILSENLAQVLWKKCVDAVKTADRDLEVPYSNTEDAWEEFLSNINKSLNDLDFEFKSIQDELTGRRLFALVNLKGDELAQMATDYTAVEIVYFKAIVEQIMLAPRESYSVSSLVALREVSELKSKVNLTKTQAETLLGSFVANGWLMKSKRGRYSLAPRALLELLPYLKSAYQDEIIECTICQEIMTKGIACQRENCKARMHLHCFQKYKQRKGECPACSIEWPRQVAGEGLVPVGEAAVRDGEDGKRRVRARSNEEESDEEPSQTQPTQRTRAQRSQKGKSKKMDVDSEEEAEEEADYEE